MRILIIIAVIFCLLAACGGGSGPAYDRDAYDGARGFIANVNKFDHELVQTACLGVDGGTSDADLIRSLEFVMTNASGRPTELKDKDQPEIRAAYAAAMRDAC